MLVSAWLVLAVGASAAPATASPISRVVELLGAMKAKIIADGHTEQALYDKYACWCDETSARKAAAIEEGKASVESLSQTILELNAAQGKSTATIKKLEKDIAENKESTAAAEELRKKEHAEYIAEKGELEQNMDAVQRAINVLAKGTTGFTPAMVETQTLTIARGVQRALKLYEKDPANKGQDLSAVHTFIANPAAWVETKSKSSYVGNVKSYDHQSGPIQGILQQMLDDFKASMGNSKAEEEQKQADYQSLMATKATELKLLEASMTKQTTDAGDDAKALETAKVEREETEKQLRADEEFFATMKAGCKNKAAEWADRSRVRTEELKGISEAMEILSSDHATETFERADTTFLQLADNRGSKTRGPRDWAYSALKRAAKTGKSIQLAALASKVYLATGESGHFDAVIGEIDAMVNVLREEEKDDIEHRDYCQTERSNADSKTEALEYDMTELGNKVARLENKAQQVQSSKAATEGEKAELLKSMEEAKAERNETNHAFRQAMSDDLESISLIEQAVAKLAPIYAKKASLVDTKAKQADAPADSPPETWGKSYEGKKSQGTGILAILGMIKEDLQKDITNAKKDEEESLASYRKLRAESQEGVDAMDAKINGFEQQLADLNQEMAKTDKLRLDKEGSVNATDDYLGDLAKSCDWILAQFESRASQRKDELNGLKNAKSILLGAGYDESNDQPTAILAVKQATPPSKGKQTPQQSYEANVDAQLRDLDSDEMGFAVPSSFLQQRRH